MVACTEIDSDDGSSINQPGDFDRQHKQYHDNILETASKYHYKISKPGKILMIELQGRQPSH